MMTESRAEQAVTHPKAMTMHLGMGRNRAMGWTSVLHLCSNMKRQDPCVLAMSPMRMVGAMMHVSSPCTTHRRKTKYRTWPSLKTFSCSSGAVLLMFSWCAWCRAYWACATSVLGGAH